MKVFDLLWLVVVSGSVETTPTTTSALLKVFMKSLDEYFLKEVKIPRYRMGERQELETLINEEAMLFAKYLRNERQTWIPRIVSLP